MAGAMYDIGYDELSSGGSTDWLVSTIGAALCTATYVPATTQQYLTDLTNELAGGGYARQALGGKTRTLTVAGEVFDGGTLDFGALALAAGIPGWLVLYRSTGVDATSPLLGYYLLPGTAPNGVDNYTLPPPTDGFFLLGPVSPYTLPEMLTFKSGS